MKLFVRNAVLALMGAVASGALASAAMAQDVDGVVVTAPYVSKTETVGKRAGEQTISLRGYVATRGLDLRYHRDIDELWRRVDYTARQTCAELERMYPDSYDTDRGCVRDAIRSARPQVNGMIRASY
jgi:UrcA family protein